MQLTSWANRIHSVLIKGVSLHKNLVSVVRASFLTRYIFDSAENNKRNVECIGYLLSIYYENETVAYAPYYNVSRYEIRHVNLKLLGTRSSSIYNKKFRVSTFVLFTARGGPKVRY